MCYGWTIRTIIFFDFLELSRIINILIVRQLFHPGLTIGSRHRCTYNITIITTMTERWNIRVKTIARGLSFSRTLSFSNPLFRAIRHLFFDLFSSFLSSSSFFFFSIASITITASLVAANEWRAAATLMNRLWAARHTDIMVPTADSWNCCARASWQINRRGREEREEERIELIFRSGQRLSTHDLFQFNCT